MPQKNKTVIILTIVMGALLQASCKPHDPVQSFENAKQYFDQGHAPVAILELKKSLQKQPDHLKSIELLNTIYASQYDYENIRILLEQSIARGIDEAGIWQSYVDALVHLAEFPLAETVVKNNQHYFNDANGLALQGHLFAGLDETKKAAEYYELALKSAPDLISAHLGIAQEAVIRAGRDRANGLALRRGKTLAKSSNKQQGNNLWVQVSKEPLNELSDEKGEINPDQRKERTFPLETAEKHLAIIFEKDSENIVAHYLTASIAYLNDDAQKARLHLQRVLKKVSEHPESLLLSGRISLEQGKLNESADFLSQYLQLRPHDLSASIYLASIALRQKEPQVALDILKDFDGLSQDNIEYLLVVGNSYLYLQRAEEAVSYFARAHKILPSSALTNMYLAMGLLANDQKEEAVVALEKVLSLEPDNEQAGISLVTTLIQLGAFDKAEQAVKALSKAHPRTPMPYYMAGVIYAEQHDHDRAIAAFQNALEEKHGFVPASLRLARIYRDQQKSDLAIKVYDGALYSSPYHPDVLTEMANTYAEIGDEEKSIELLELARDRNVNALTPRLILGGYYLRRAQVAQAEKILQELTKIGATRSDVKMFMAQAFLSTGRVNDALKLYEELVQIRPDSPELLTRYASALIQTGATQQGRKTLSVARQIKGQASLDTLQVLGELELQENQFEKSKEIAHEIINTYPDLPAGDLLKGDLFLKMDQPEHAIEAYTLATQKSDRPQTLLKLADAMIQAEQNAAAEKLLDEATQRHTSDMRLGLMLANLYHQKGEQNAEIETYLDLLKRFPDNAVILNNLAWLHEKLDVQKSFSYAVRAYEIMPDMPAIQDTYGWFCVLTGRYDEGIYLIESAIKQAPENAEFHYHLAEAQLKSGKHESAKASLTIALASQKTFPQRGKAEALMLQLESTLN